MYEIFHFQSEGATLQMRIDLSQDESSNFVLYFPGVSGHAISPKTDGLAEAFTNAGFHFVRFEYRSYLKKDDFGCFSLNDDLTDIAHAITFLNSQFPDLKYGAIGKRFGSLRLLLSKDLNRFECFGLLAPAIFVGDANTVELLSNKEYSSISGVNDFRVTTGELRNISSPVIIIHEKDDSVVPISNSEILISYFQNPRNRFVCIDGSSHSFEDENGSSILFKEVPKFFSENF